MYVFLKNVCKYLKSTIKALAMHISYLYPKLKLEPPSN